MRPEDQARLDDWHIWRGVTGIWYGSRVNSSPQHLKRDWDRARLVQRIMEGEPPPWQSR